MNVLLITTDLLAASQFEGAASAAGAQLFATTPKKAIEKARELSARLVAVELAAKQLDDLPGLVSQLKALPAPPAVIAFGPHVQEVRLQAALDAGCDEVLTRGQFSRLAGEVIARYASPSPGSTTPDDATGSSSK